MQSGLCVGSHTVLPNDTVKIQKHPIPDVEGEIADAICDPSLPQLQESSVLTCARISNAREHAALLQLRQGWVADGVGDFSLNVGDRMLLYLNGVIG